MRLALVALLIGGCDLYTGGDDSAPDAAVEVDAATVPCVANAGTTCEAAHSIAISVCERNLRCSPDSADDLVTCMRDVVSELCSERDCSAPYGDRERLDACLANYDAQPCVVIGPLMSCEL